MSDQGARLMSDGNDAENKNARRLGTASPLEPPQCELVEQVLTGFKVDLGQSGLAFDALAEMIADIRTIEAQLASPKPKTPIVRECFASLLSSARENRQEERQRIVEELLG
jgi:hypothetical protein